MRYYLDSIGSGITSIARKTFSRVIYPVHKGDWYEKKGFLATSFLSAFDSFAKAQEEEGKNFPAMKNLRVERVPEDQRPTLMMSGGSESTLDTVTLHPQEGNG